ncbi:hypothetical protein ATCC90586_008010 [Pythium insidiosum]|nr:hypothetical protein ATCC90586_008010 [Pythium insidiosum]
MGKGKEFGLAKKGKIAIAVDKPSYVAGEIVNGSIFVTVHEPIQCDAVVLKATGKEKVKWEQHDGEGMEEYEREHEFFKQKIVITAVPHVLQPGSYTYPFTYQLPPSLPGVFAMERYSSMFIEDLNASIKYKFKATLDVGGYYAKDLKANCNIVVHEQLTQTIRASEDSTTQSVNFLCCLNKGNCTLSVAMDKNVYFPGETAQIQCTVNNNSSVDITAMRARLFQDLTLMLNYGPSTFTTEIAVQDFPGVAAGKSLSQPQPLALVPNRQGFVNPSTNGTIITCSYRIEIEADIPWCPDVQLHLPVTIIAPVMPSPTSYVPPATAGYAAPGYAQAPTGYVQAS